MEQRFIIFAGIQRQISRLDLELTDLNAISARLTTWRVITFVGGLLAVGAAWNTAFLFPAAFIAVLIFAFLIRQHRRIKSSIEQHKTYKLIKQRHIARMEIDWQKLPESHASAPVNHPFAYDLDIVGPYSLHRLLDTSVSKGGSQRLLNWLLITKPDLKAIRARRVYLNALVGMTTFRDKLTMNATLSKGRGKWDGQRLIHWLRASTEKNDSSLLLGALVLLSLTTFTLMLLDALNVVSSLWAISMVVYVVLYAVRLRGSGDTFSEALTIKAELDNLTSVFHFIEGYNFTAVPKIEALCTPFKQSERKPTTQLRRLNIIMAALSLRANPIFWFMVNLLIPWDAYFVQQLNRSKGSLASSLPEWLDIWYELEALTALATFEYLNPDYTAPALTIENAMIEARTLGHPLIPYDVRVNNDYTLESPDKVHIVTGSNMSGKSSFLRTVGVNLQLAYAGAVVAATSYEAGLFRVFTCIKVTDSIVDGISYFYAEVRRLKALMDAVDADPMPLLFLIDEIFRGTNNRERLIGSSAYIRHLAESRAYGLISTHDLELVQLEEEITGVTNYHFREEVQDGLMIFDYTLRAGPSPTTNALTIMEQAGLPVAKQPQEN